jgi:hypothetical protein
MKKIIMLAFVFTLTLSIASCGGSSKSSTSKTDDKAKTTPTDIHHSGIDFVDLDLASFGVPAKMKAPKNTKVTQMNDGSLLLQAGKYYQMTLTVNNASLSEEYIEMVKVLAQDHDANSSFDRFLANETNGVLKANKDGELNFTWAAPAGNGCLVATNGVQHDKAIGGYTKQEPIDIKIMWESAKTLALVIQ